MKEAVEAVERRHAKPFIQLKMTRKLYSPEPGAVQQVQLRSDIDTEKD